LFSKLSFNSIIKPFKYQAGPVPDGLTGRQTRARTVLKRWLFHIIFVVEKNLLFFLLTNAEKAV